MTSTYSGKSSRQAISSKHGETTDVFSWEGSSVKTRSKNSSFTLHHSTKSNLHHSAKSKNFTKTASSDHVRKSTSQNDNVSLLASSVIPSPSHHSSSGGASQITSTSLSRIGAQLLEQDSIWCEIKQEFPTLTDYFQEMQLDKKVSQMLTNLFRLKQLPFSPYSQLMCELRPTMERYMFYIFSNGQNFQGIALS